MALGFIGNKTDNFENPIKKQLYKQTFYAWNKSCPMLFIAIHKYLWLLFVQWKMIKKDIVKHSIVATNLRNSCKCTLCMRANSVRIYKNTAMPDVNGTLSK